MPFPRHLPEYNHFLKFMEKSTKWNIKAMNAIKAFKEEVG